MRLHTELYYEHSTCLAARAPADPTTVPPSAPMALSSFGIQALLLLSLSLVISHCHSHVHAGLPLQMVHEDFDVSPISHLSPLTHHSHQKLKTHSKRDISYLHKNHHYNDHHQQALQISFSAYNQTFLLDLQPHLDLIHHDAKAVLHTGLTTEEHPLRFYVYDGKVFGGRGQERGWARIVLHESELENIDQNPQYEGVFSFGASTFQIRSVKTYARVKRSQDMALDPNIHKSHKLIVYSDQKESPKWDEEELKFSSHLYKRSSFKEPVESSSFGLANETLGKRSCGLDSNMWSPQQDREHSNHLFRRQNGAGCPSTKKILYMSTAADCTYFRWYESLSSTLKQIILNWNSASKLYESTFNIGLGLIKVEIQASCNKIPAWNQECDSKYGIDQRLSDFSIWRSSARAGDSAGLWHLMTACASGTSLGIAWPATICQQTVASSLQPSTGTAVSSMGKEEWKIVAHEIGHNFGARHDCGDENCKAGSKFGGTVCCPCGTCDCKAQYST